ncbi:hypothetical protein JTE90_017186 [Oedothorax gibbosus]|uniref:Uncharacterized protein n=1 Tax=Oedothorax gibbosus TaxID=931172 RepID=A0AAV6V8L9_9ARAC|nr:hypothetical protein JTE90_017186 [Oedothorax gibbosus]
MSVSLGEVEAFVAACRERLEADRRELQDEQERTSALYQQVQNYAQEEKENSPVLYTGAESRPTSSRSTIREENFPSHLSSLFGEEEEFFPFKEDEGRRRRLAQERQNEYNTFLRRKEETEAARKKVAEEKVAPRSILESVDYDKVLARMKAQEAQFRNVNRAEPSLEESSSSLHFSPVQKYTPEQKKSVSVVSNGPYHTNKYLVERDKDFSRPQSSDRKVFHAPTSTSTISKNVETHPTPKRQNDTSRPESSGKKTYQSPVGEHQRRGGGGDPLRDANGNLITTRGYLSFPSQQQNLHRNQQMFYREQLQQQIEERRALEAEERRRLREEEEALARRAEEQRLRMLREYEEEQAKSLRKNEQRESERQRQLEEYKLREAALRQKRAPPPPVPEVPVPMERPKSPPIPAVRSKTILNNTPPILVDVKPENVFSSLSEIRRSLMQEQPQKDFKNSYEVMNRRTVLDDDEELE